jgi:hypothetical protein
MLERWLCWTFCSTYYFLTFVGPVLISLGLVSCELNYLDGKLALQRHFNFSTFSSSEWLFCSYACFDCRSTRETTPCSLIRNSETISTPGSTTKSKTSSSMTSRRRVEASACRFIPSSLEMEEFFSAAEQQEQHVFREKYDLLLSLSICWNGLWFSDAIFSVYDLIANTVLLLFWLGITSVLWMTARFLDGMSGQD